LIKTILSTTKKRVLLIYSNRKPADAIFLKELSALEKQSENRLVIRYLFSSNFNVYSSRLSKWLLEQILEQELTDEKNKLLFYLCGPESYMQMSTIVLLGNSFPSAHILKENFNTLPRMQLPEPPDREQHMVTLLINHERIQLPVQYPKSILAAAKSAGIDIPYSCEAGRCGSCAATCTQGKTWMAYNEVLMEDEILKGRILTCQAYPVGGDVEIVI
jgi:ring-1,2-phenylacetyl-CoA epoxidase subunit PaaE